MPLGGEITFCLNLTCWEFSTKKKYLTLSYLLQHIQDLHIGLFQNRVIAQNETWAAKREKGSRELLWHTCESQTFGLLMRLRSINQDVPQGKEYFYFCLNFILVSWEAIIKRNMIKIIIKLSSLPYCFHRGWHCFKLRYCKSEKYLLCSFFLTWLIAKRVFGN